LTSTGPFSRTLRTDLEIESSIARLAELGLPEHRFVRAKSWDLALAIDAVKAFVPLDGRILDAGASVSPILEDLARLGYRDLWAVDLRGSRRQALRRVLTRSPIRFRREDLMRTSFPDQTFDAITCLSVIEHGVDLGRYMREAARLLRQGGVLFTSTDYWCEPIDTRGIYPYGPSLGEMRIFGPDDIRHLVELGAEAGLVPIEPLDLDCQAPLVEWFGRRYTFVTLLLRRGPAALS
jgi:SAM-dependent methyltransferase